MPPVDEDTIKKRVEWLKSCGIKMQVIRRNRLNTPLEDVAFQLIVRTMFRDKHRKKARNNGH